MRCCYSPTVCRDDDESWSPEALQSLAEHYVQIVQLTLLGPGLPEWLVCPVLRSGR